MISALLCRFNQCIIFFLVIQDGVQDGRYARPDLFIFSQTNFTENLTECLTIFFIEGRLMGLYRGRRTKVRCRPMTRGRIQLGRAVVMTIQL